MIQPRPSDIRARSDLLSGKYLPPDGQDQPDDPLWVLVQDAQQAVQAFTGRLLGDGAVGASPFTDAMEQVVAGQEGTAYRAVAYMAEEFSVMQERRNARRRAGRLRLRGFTAGPYCVPLDTEALTPHGWRSYGEMVPGDLVLGFDAGAGVARWTRVLEVVAPFEAEIVRVGHRWWSARCTPDHRWVIRTKHDHGGKRHRLRDVPGEWRPERLRDFARRGRYELLVAAPALTDHRLPISAAEAALVGWLLTDGHVERRDEASAQAGRRLTRMAHIRGTIYQKRFRREVESALATAGAPHTVVAPERTHGEMARYRIRSPWLRDLWDRAELWASSPLEFVLKLGAQEREAFLAAGMLAEGTLPKASRSQRAQASGEWYRWHFGQNRGPVLDAYVVAAHLSGYSARPWASRARQSGFALARASHTNQRITVTPAGHEPVWCLRTELGTWTMRQGDVVSLTGNSENYWDPAMVRGGQSGIGRRPQIVDDPELDDLLWQLATEDARDTILYLSQGLTKPIGVLSAFDYRRQGGGYFPAYANARQVALLSGPDGV